MISHHCTTLTITSPSIITHHDWGGKNMHPKNFRPTTLTLILMAAEDVLQRKSLMSWLPGVRSSQW
jgi:hypothetical protein